MNLEKLCLFLSHSRASYVNNDHPVVRVLAGASKLGTMDFKCSLVLKINTDISIRLVEREIRNNLMTMLPHITWDDRFGVKGSDGRGNCFEKDCWRKLFSSKFRKEGWVSSSNESLLERKLTSCPCWLLANLQKWVAARVERINKFVGNVDLFTLILVGTRHMSDLYLEKSNIGEAAWGSCWKLSEDRRLQLWQLTPLMGEQRCVSLSQRRHCGRTQKCSRSQTTSRTRWTASGGCMGYP